MIELRWHITEERPPPYGSINIGQAPQSCYMVLQCRYNTLVAVDGVTEEVIRRTTEWKNVGVETP